LRQKAKICHISTEKKKVKLAIIRALVRLCHKCIVEFEKNLLLSLISSQILVVTMFSYLAKLKKYPDVTMGKLESNIEILVPHFIWRLLPVFCYFNFNLLEVSIPFPLGNAKKVYWDLSGTIAS